MRTWEHIGDLSGNGETLLVFDQDYLMRELLTDILEINGYNVIMAMNPGHARTIIESRGDSIDLIITDIKSQGLGELMNRVLSNVTIPMMVFTREKLPVKNPPTFIGVTMLEKPFDVLEFFKTIKESLSEEYSSDTDSSEFKSYC